MNKNNSLQYIFNSIIGVAIILLVFIILWASNRGLDLTDEGFYLFHYSMPVNVKIFVYPFHLIQNSLFSFVNCTIQNLRIERLVLSILCALLFAYCSAYYLTNSSVSASYKKPSFSLFSLIIAGVFLSYAFGPQTPSYNIFSSLFIIAASSLFLIDISKPQPKWIVVILYLFIGTACGILLLVKFPNAFLLSGTFIVFYFLYNILTPVSILTVGANTIFRLFLIALGYLIFHLFFLKGIYPMVQYHKDFFDYVAQMKGYEKTTLIRIYLSSFTRVYESLCTVKFLLILSTFTGIVWCLIKKHNKLFYLFLFGQLAIIFKFKMYYGGEANKTEQTIIYLLWILTFIILFFIKNTQDKSLRTTYFKQRLLFALFLLFMPIVGSIGTNNLLHIQIIFYMPFWMLLIYLIIENNFENKFSVPIYAFIVLLALTQSADAIVMHPYRISTDLFSQNQKLLIGKDETILVDKKYKENVLTIDYLLKKNDFKRGDYIFTYSNAAGLAYIYNYPLPTTGSGWFNSNNDVANCKTLELFNIAAHKVQLFFILDKRYPFSQSFKDCLTQLGYDFDNNYYKAGEVWVDFSNDPHYLSIYAPL